MPYFPKREETAYKCHGCGKKFYPGNLSRCVLHAPGTCCHMGEVEVPESLEVGIAQELQRRASRGFTDMFNTFRNAGLFHKGD